MSILVIEDDKSLRDILFRGLSEEGFEIDLAENGKIGLDKALAKDYQCLILDIMLPEIDGFELCRKLREQNRIYPIIMLTAKKDVDDRVNGLDVGADDYITKPFSFDELLARIRAQIRRNSNFTSDMQCFNSIRLDANNLLAVCNGLEVELTHKEFQLLRYFLQNSGRVIADKELIEKVWGLPFDPKTNIVNVYLHRLRSKFHVDGSEPLIETIRGKGYRLKG